MRLKLQLGFMLLLAAGCGKQTPPAEARGLPPATYRAVDDATILVIRSATEAELTMAGEHYVCQYTVEGNRIRVTMVVLGAQQAYYYDLTPEGLKDERGVTLYKPEKLESAIAEAQAQQKQAVANKKLLAACSSGNLELAQAALKDGANVATQDSDGFAPLHLAAWAERANPDLVVFLLKSGADVNARSKNKSTPLHCAANPKSNLKRDGSSEIVRLLLEAKADINAQREDGQTPLLEALVNSVYVYADQKESRAIVAMLVKAGADRTLRNREGVSASEFVKKYPGSLTPELLMTKAEALRAGITLDQAARNQTQNSALLAGANGTRPQGVGVNAFNRSHPEVLYLDNGLQIIAPAPQKPGDNSRDQLLAWLANNNKFGPNHQIVSDAKRALATATDRDFAILLGRDLVKSRRATELKLLNECLYLIEYTDDEMELLGAHTAATTSVLRKSADTRVDPLPVKLGAIAPDPQEKRKLQGIHTGTLDLAVDKPLDPAASYAVRLTYQIEIKRDGKPVTVTSTLFSYLDKPLKVGKQSVKFKFDARQDPTDKPMPVVMRMELVLRSDPKGMLPNPPPDVVLSDMYLVVMDSNP